jgi:transketolase
MLREKLINTVRFLSADAVEKAQSGHPGLPLGAAPAGYVLYDKIMKHNPANSKWFDRDRFILSAGHGSMMLYSLLHLYGYDLPMTELENFRQLGSKTPGHPEFGHTDGVETTTGPLGQGFANAVGMAMAEKLMAKTYNRAGHTIVDHHTYTLVGDGCLMEGITNEAASMAGHLKLGKLIALYDSNMISIEGSTDIAFTEDVAKRFEALEWQVLTVEDGNDVDAIEKAVLEAKAEEERPSLVIVKTVIGYGSGEKAGTADVHGAPLGAEAIAGMREFFDWTYAPFEVPEEVASYLEEKKKELAAHEADWIERFEAYKAAYPELAEQFENALLGKMESVDFDEIEKMRKKTATRASSGEVLNMLAKKNPQMVGGSADLAPSNKSEMKGIDHFTSAEAGRNLHFGVREHAMGAVANGLALHGGLKVYASTFLVFSDYMKPAIRLAALSNIDVTYVFTHDSIGVGEDGPTHQPIEHLTMLRSIPNVMVYRPADYFETAVCWQCAMEDEGPSVLALTRQGLDNIPTTSLEAKKGAYVVRDAETPDLIFMASGSEVNTCLGAADLLAEEGVHARVISVPSMERFNAQGAEYRASLLPAGIPRVAVEAGVTMPWYRYMGEKDHVIGLDTFGASGEGSEVFEHFGLTPAGVAARAKSVL